MALYWLRAGHNGRQSAQCAGSAVTRDEPRVPWNIDGNKISWTQGNSIVATAVVATVEDTLSRYLSANFSPANRIYDGPSSYQGELKCPPGQPALSPWESYMGECMSWIRSRKKIKKVLKDCLLFFSSYVLVIRNPFKILKSYPIYLKYQKILF